MSKAMDKESFPGLPLQLESGDDGYERGRRFGLEQLDGERYTFRTRDDMDEFARVHGFVYVGEQQMTEARVAFDSQQ